MELHTKHFIANKKPYRKYFGVLPVEKKFILLSEYAEFISSLPLKAINTCINKNKLTSKNQIPVLELAMKFTIQRIENDLQANRNNFIIISDRGRLAAMRYVTRKLQAFNYVPSKFKKETYPNPIKLLLEDPMEKESTQSYFIQFSDFISFIVYHKLMKELSINEPSRKIEEFGHDKIDCLFQKVRSIFNLKACSDRREDGIFIYPK